MSSASRRNICKEGIHSLHSLMTYSSPSGSSVAEIRLCLSSLSAQIGMHLVITQHCSSPPCFSPHLHLSCCLLTLAPVQILFTFPLYSTQISFLLSFLFVIQSHLLSLQKFDIFMQFQKKQCSWKQYGEAAKES